jgi:hypothetical protein
MLAAQAPDLSSDSVLKFRTMAGVRGPFVGTSNPIRGVPGGGFPWIIADGRGELKADGRLSVRVTGLVLADDPTVPENLRLTNPVPAFRAIVSCRTIDGMGNPAIVNASTDGFPANNLGDAKINAELQLPEPCFAPILFVTSPGGAWFAVSGR